MKKASQKDRVSLAGKKSAIGTGFIWLIFKNQPNKPGHNGLKIVKIK